MTADEIDLVMRDVGPLDDAIAEVLRLADGRWVIRFEAAEVEGEFDDNDSDLTLLVRVPSPHPENRLRVYEALLLYNASWRETGGVRMALAEPGGDILQAITLRAATLTPGEVAIVAANLAARALTWRAFFDAEPEDAPDVFVPGEVMIRI